MRKFSRDISELKKTAKSSYAGHLVLLEVIGGIIVSVGSILLFIKLRFEVLERSFDQMDLQILLFLKSIRTPLLTDIMFYTSYFGWEILVGAGVVIAILLMVHKHKREALLFTFMVVMAVFINNALKILIQRERPQLDPLIVAKDFSFPSGHAMTSFVFYVTLAYLIFHFTKNKKLAIISVAISALIIFLIGISRVYLGVHYPSDVIAGYVGGLAWFASVFLIQKTLVFFELFKETNKKRKR